MKNILITTLLVASTLSLNAAADKREYDGYMKIGFDVSGGKDDTTGSVATYNFQ